jgi:hypothetical protein
MAHCVFTTLLPVSTPTRNPRNANERRGRRIPWIDCRTEVPRESVHHDQQTLEYMHKMPRQAARLSFSGTSHPGRHPGRHAGRHAGRQMQQRPQGQVLLGISDGKQTETEFLALGLSLGGYGTERQHVREVLNHTRFRALYGIGPKSAAALWKDLKASNDKARKEGFFLFLNWLKEYRSYHGLGGLWNLDEDTIATKVWWYAKAVQSLKPNKIKFEGFGSDEIFIATVDGVHCRINEPRTDAGTKWYSHKFNGPGVCYEIAISIRRDNVLWISGPHCASVHDITIFRGGKKNKAEKPKCTLL